MVDSGTNTGESDFHLRISEYWRLFRGFHVRWVQCQNTSDLWTAGNGCCWRISRRCWRGNCRYVYKLCSPFQSSWGIHASSLYDYPGMDLCGFHGSGRIRCVQVTSLDTIKNPSIKKRNPNTGHISLKAKSADYFLYVIDYLGDLRIYYFVAAATQYFNQGRTCRRYSTANLFGFVVERGTICMSSMLKEWFISRSAYVWRSVLFTVMCLALLYQTGLHYTSTTRLWVENYVQAPNFWFSALFSWVSDLSLPTDVSSAVYGKPERGISLTWSGIFGLLGGIGLSQIAKTIFVKESTLSSSLIQNHLTSILSPVVSDLSYGFWECYCCCCSDENDTVLMFN